MSAEGLRDDYGRDGKKQRENSKGIRKGFLTTTFSDSFPCDVYLSGLARTVENMDLRWIHIRGSGGRVHSVNFSKTMK